jgi:hypothetical protein
MPCSYKKNAIRILQFLAFSDRTLRIDEAVDAMAINLEKEPCFNPDARICNTQEITRYCSSLVVIMYAKGDSDDRDREHLELQVAHPSVQGILNVSQVGRRYLVKFSGNGC